MPEPLTLTRAMQDVADALGWDKPMPWDAAMTQIRVYRLKMEQMRQVLDD